MKTLSISEAKRHLGKVADLALEGEPVIIMHRSKPLMLQPYQPPEPVPLRPPGYFSDCYTKPEADESNRIAARGPRKVVK